MRFLLIVTAILLSMSASGAAQQKHYRVKPSSTDVKTGRKNVPAEKLPAASTATARDLRNIERQTAKTAPAARRTPTKKQSVALKPPKDKANPPINFSGKGQGTGASGAKQGSNPLKGRLKQKRGGGH